MKMAFLGLCAGLASAADLTPPPPKPKPAPPMRLYSVQRATLVANPKTKLRVEWDHYGPGSQFISFEVWGHTNAALPSMLLAKTTNTYWERYFTSGPMVFVRQIYAIDVDQPNKSKPLLWGSK